MSSKLPINLNALLHQRTVEGDRIEYKAGWNPDAIIKTLWIKIRSNAEDSFQPSSIRIWSHLFANASLSTFQLTLHRDEKAFFGLESQVTATAKNCVCLRPSEFLTKFCNRGLVATISQFDVGKQVIRLVRSKHAKSLAIAKHSGNY